MDEQERKYLEDMVRQRNSYMNRVNELMAENNQLQRVARNLVNAVMSGEALRVASEALRAQALLQRIDPLSSPGR